jgi:hypothetical protein
MANSTVQTDSFIECHEEALQDGLAPLFSNPVTIIRIDEIIIVCVLEVKEGDCREYIHDDQ